MADALAGVDWNQYGNWTPIQAPTGQVYYKIPGTGYVYDPFLSSQKGRPVIWSNPEPAVKEREKQEKAAKDAASPLGQLAPIGGSIAGLVGAKYALNALGPATAAEKLAEAKAATELAALQGAQGTTAAASPIVDGAVGAAAETPMARLAAEGLETPLETAMDVPVTGATPQTSFLEGLMPQGGMPIQQGFTVGNVLGGLATAKGLYDTVGGLQHGGKGLRSGLTEAGMGAGTLVGGPLGAAIGGLAGNAIGYGLQGKGIKNDLALLGVTGGLGAPLVIARHLGFDPIHKTTRQVAQEHTANLLKEGKDDPQWQNYVSGMREQFNAPPPDKEHPFAGKYKTWDEYEKAGLDSNDLTGVYGNLKTFGPDWSKLSLDDQKKVTQGIIDAGLYKSKKGEVEITDKDQAKKIKDQVLGITPPPPPTMVPQVQSPIGAPPSPNSTIGQQLAQRMNQRR